METGFFILDVDCGVDDAYAILLATTLNPDKILAITTCHGNTTLENVVKNTQAILQVAGLKNKIPIYKGCSKPLLGDISDEQFFGADGLNNVGSKYWVKEQDIPKEAAANALVRLASEYKGQITLVALAPLTNLAVAQQVCPEFSSLLRQTIILGGNTEGLGNVNSCAEFNFLSDPVAAKFVLREFSCPLKIVPWETAFRTTIPISYFEELATSSKELSYFLRDISSTLIKYHKEHLGQEEMNLGDFYAVLVAFYPSVIVDSRKWPASVETAGEVTKGLCVVDKRIGRETSETFRKVEFILSLDRRKILHFFSCIFDQKLEAI